MKIKVPISCIVAILAVATYAAIDGISLKLTPKVGDVKKYKQTAKLVYNGMELDFAAVATRSIVKVEDSGVFQQKEEVSEMKINGNEAPAGSAPGATTTTFSTRGAVLKVDGDHVDDSLVRAANLGVFVMPEKPVQVGDKWEFDIKEDKATGAVAGTAKYSVLAEEKVGSIATVKVKFTIKELDTAGGSTDGTVWLSKTDGGVVKMTAKWVNVPMSGAGTISGELTEILIQ